MEYSSVAGADSQSTVSRHDAHSKSVEKASFFSRAVSVVCHVMAFVVGAVFFPVTSIALVVHVYLNQRVSPEKSMAKRFVELLNAFFIPVPIVGVIALISDGYWKDVKNNSDLLGFGILCIPCVASGLFLSMVLHQRLFAEKSSDTT